mmetsp:Transcript_23794/g.54021  ORF Transcript_23794/g.54021 Transcript_23794/m.54021 type:complete len:217 (-) Transcript_23794:615-1265(-)
MESFSVCGDPEGGRCAHFANANDSRGASPLCQTSGEMVQVIRAAKLVMVGTWVQWGAFGTAGISATGAAWMTFAVVGARLQFELMDGVMVCHVNSGLDVSDVLEHCTVAAITLRTAEECCSPALLSECGHRLSASTRRTEQVLQQKEHHTSLVLNQLCTLHRAFHEIPRCSVPESLLRSVKQAISSTKSQKRAPGKSCNLSRRNADVISSLVHTSW